MKVQEQEWVSGIPGEEEGGEWPDLKVTSKEGKEDEVMEDGVGRVLVYSSFGRGGPQNSGEGEVSSFAGIRHTPLGTC